MSTLTVHTTATGEFVVRHTQSSSVTEAGTEDKGPSPIAPEVKELAWGAGSFVVLFVLMRVVLVPRLKKGMQARYGKIRGDHDAATTIRSEAQADLASYERDLAAVKAEAAQRVDAARATIESERSAALSDVNERIASRRAAANAAAESVRSAAEKHVRSAVADVSGRAAELATGRRPDDAAMDAALEAVMGARQ